MGARSLVTTEPSCGEVNGRRCHGLVYRQGIAAAKEGEVARLQSLRPRLAERLERRLLSCATPGTSQTPKAVLSLSSVSFREKQKETCLFIV